MKTVLIVGLGGIGAMYFALLKDKPEYIVHTIDVDSTKSPTYKHIKDIHLDMYHKYDLVIVCTPNCAHEYYVEILSKFSKVILVEKPGLYNTYKWKYYNTTRNCKIILVKNNIYRPQIAEIRKYIKQNDDNIAYVSVQWINKNRIPSPGSWFTDKSKSWGGVSMDLIPHLLSIYYSIVPEVEHINHITKFRHHSLESLIDSEYGTVYKDGVYDVDDYCSMYFGDDVKYDIIANWKSDDNQFTGVHIHLISGDPIKYDFGFCPDGYYLDMIEDVTNLDDLDYKKHYMMDMWIHEQLDKIRDTSTVNSC